MTTLRAKKQKLNAKEIKIGKTYLFYPNPNKSNLPNYLKNKPVYLGKLHNFNNLLRTTNLDWGSFIFTDPLIVTSKIDSDPLITEPIIHTQPGRLSNSPIPIIIRRIVNTANPEDDYIFQEVIPYNAYNSYSMLTEQLSRQTNLPKSTGEVITSFLSGYDIPTDRTPAPPVEKGGKTHKRKTHKRKTHKRKTHKRKIKNTKKN